MLIPSLAVSAIYAYGTTFRHYILDAVLVIAITYMMTALAAAILPWRRPELYTNSPIARYKIDGIPLVTLAGVITFAFLAFNLVYWFEYKGYFVNDAGSFLFMRILYVVAIDIYVVAKAIRKRQGIDSS